INDTVPIEVDARDNLGVETINVTLRNATGALVNATMDRLTGTAVDGTWRADFNRTQAEGFYNLTKLFVHDTYGNLNVTNVSGAFEVGRLSTTIDASPQSTSIDDNVVIGVNVSGNITRTTDVVAKITKPRSYVETVDMQLEPEMASEYAVVYGNTSRSGSYDVNVSVTAGVTVSNMTRNLFAIDFGQLAAEPLSGNGTHLTLPLDASPYQLSWSITPDTGDLIDVWANASVNNTSVIELQDATPGRDVGNVTYEAGDTRVTYGLNGRDVGSTVFNLSVNASNGDQQLYVPINVTVVGEDAQAPNITSYDESPSEVNKNQPVTITATVEENSIVKNLTLVVQHPVNGSNYTEAPVAMEQVDRGTYRYRFTNTSETGHYTYRIRAWDIALNNDTIHSNSFDVKEQFSVNVTSARQLFKKADTGSFDITVRDVNGDVIDGYNTTIVMDKAGTNVTMFDDGFKDLFKYTFKRSDPPSPVASEVPKQYTLYVNVSKAGNIGRTAYTFNVTRLLDVSFLSPEQGDTVAPGSEFRLRVNITGPNGEVVEGIMYARCEQCPSQYKFLNFAGGGVFVQNFTAPQDDDSALIRVFASDLQGNTESQDSGPLSAAPAITINVGNESGTGGTGAGGGGGGGGGFGTRFQIEKQSPQQVSLPSNTSQVNLSVSTNLAASCRYTNRSLSIVRVDAMNRFNRTGGTLHWAVVSTQPGRTYRYNVFCQQSTGGNATLEVVFSIEPETVASFGLFIPDTIPPDGSGVEQGSVGKAPFSIYNNGSESIQIDVDAVVRRCCSAWISNESTRVDTVTLTPGSEKSLTINVDVPLNTSLGSYTAGLSFASGGRVREKTVQMRVVKGTDIRRLENLKQRAQQLVQQIRNYRRSGINTSALMQDYQRLQKLIGYAEQAVAQDDRQVLANTLDQADTKANEIKGKLRALAFKNYVLENWWKWLFGGIAIYTLFFLLTMVAVPYYRLRTDYLTVKEKLESATQARKKAERQYFKRQIDRDTFMDIMTERQDEILELRSERDELQEELDTAIKSRLTAENYIKAPIKAVREINRWIESRRNKMVAERESSE
ncbi:MAG: hypothetical protein SV186_05200, partial [Candidatus Nanohaloarchaea archaeon]|nr:hypothetical protein [Candidatus Nanohaloarchaea archaeon]